MKKIIALMLVIALALAFAACNAKPSEETTATTTTAVSTETEAETTTVATTTATETTTVETTTTTTTEETTTTATTAEPEPEKLDFVTLADVDFTDGKVTDACGLLDFYSVKGSVGKVNVTHAGKQYTVDAYSVTKKGEAAMAKIDSLKTAEETQTFFDRSFTVEAFYINRAKANAVEAVFCGTERGGWGLADDAGGKPYFIIGVNRDNTYKSVKPGRVISNTDITHVIAVFDKDLESVRIYINGVFAGEQDASGSFYSMKTPYHNVLTLGADVTDKGAAGHFQATDMTIVDAKIYLGALGDSDAELAYKLAVDALEK
ncbi:MAG: hypothetical protein IJR55_07155 [Clostridia bacterium]|nr:hypothetical protein [Clostridia bacterium]